MAPVGKNPPPVQETQETVSIPGWEDPLEKEMEPTPAFLPAKSHRQRSLAGYSPWSHKESDTTERAWSHKESDTTERTCTHSLQMNLKVRQNLENSNLKK